MRSLVGVLGWIKRWFPKAFPLGATALRDRLTRIWMSTLRLFPHESMNSRRGSDVPEGGESSGMASLKFARLDLDISSRIWERGGEGRHQRLKRNKNPRFWFGGIYTPTRVIGSTDTGSVLPRGRRNWDRESLSVVPMYCRFYRGWSVEPTLCRFNLEQPKFQQWALIGTSDLLSVVPSKLADFERWLRT
jgi:hypothetical protein